MNIEFTHVRISCDRDPELPRKYGKKIKSMEGWYTECRGEFSKTRYVTIPVNTEDGRSLANEMTIRYQQGRRTRVEIRGLTVDGISLEVPSSLLIHNVPCGTEDPVGFVRANIYKFQDVLNQMVRALDAARIIELRAQEQEVRRCNPDWLVAAREAFETVPTESREAVVGVLTAACDAVNIPPEFGA